MFYADGSVIFVGQQISNARVAVWVRKFPDVVEWLGLRHVVRQGHMQFATIFGN
jgi:hypothetical protein